MVELLDSFMTFKEWFEWSTAMHGGIYGPVPGSHLNNGKKGLNSKYQASDYPKEPPSDVNPDKTFGFTGQKDKARLKDKPKPIDIPRGAPIRTPIVMS